MNNFSVIKHSKVQVQHLLILFSIDNSIANINFVSWQVTNYLGYLVPPIFFFYVLLLHEEILYLNFSDFVYPLCKKKEKKNLDNNFESHCQHGLKSGNPKLTFGLSGIKPQIVNIRQCIAQNKRENRARHQLHSSFFTFFFLFLCTFFFFQSEGYYLPCNFRPLFVVSDTKIARYIFRLNFYLN